MSRIDPLHNYGVKIGKIALLGLPTFQKEWEDEFKIYSYKPGVLRTGCVIAVIWCLYDFSSMTFSDQDSAGGDRVWIFWTYSVDLFCSIIFSCVSFVLSLKQFHNFSVRNYDMLCLIVVVSAYCTMIFIPLMLEIRRSLFQWSAEPYIRWSIDRSGTLPVRICNNSNPVASWQNFSANGHNAIGCDLLLLSGSILAFYVFCNLCPIAFGMCPIHATASSAINLLILLAALLSTGAFTDSGTGFAAAAATLQLVLGLSSAHFCAARRRRAQDRFALSKVNSYTTILLTNMRTCIVG